jgi:hypothetical protein
MSTLSDTLNSVLGGGVTSGLLFLGTRYVARSSRQASDTQSAVENRKVNKDEFESFKQTYREDMERMGERLRSEEERSARYWNTLRVAVHHITELRGVMRANNVTPPAMPSELITIPYDITGTDTTEG